VLSNELKKQVLFSLDFILTKTPKGKRVSSCSDCVARMLKQLETDDEPFIKYFCEQVVSKQGVTYSEVYSFVKSHWEKSLNDTLVRLTN
jgi:hypothetical protein